MVTSIDTEKACDKIQHPPTIKTLSKLGTKRTFLFFFFFLWTFLNLIKAVLNRQEA